jgi:hypothetical protein
VSGVAATPVLDYQQRASLRHPFVCLLTSTSLRENKGVPHGEPPIRDRCHTKYNAERSEDEW